MGINIYEFPEGYEGRKTYVSVEGHSRSIPFIYTYKARGRNRLLPEYGGGPIEHTGAGPMILRDIQPYRSPLDGSYVTSRSSHREHMERHNVIEIGNEKIKPAPERNTFKGVGSEIKRHIDTVKAMPQKQYDSIVADTQKKIIENTTGA